MSQSKHLINWLSSLSMTLTLCPIPATGKMENIRSSYTLDMIKLNALELAEIQWEWEWEWKDILFDAYHRLDWCISNYFQWSRKKPWKIQRMYLNDSFCMKNRGIIWIWSYSQRASTWQFLWMETNVHPLQLNLKNRLSTKLNNLAQGHNQWSIPSIQEVTWSGFLSI